MKDNNVTIERDKNRERQSDRKTSVSPLYGSLFAQPKFGSIDLLPALHLSLCVCVCVHNVLFNNHANQVEYIKVRVSLCVCGGVFDLQTSCCK